MSVTIKTGNVNFPNHSLAVRAFVVNEGGREDHLYRFAPQSSSGRTDTITSPHFTVEKGTVLPARPSVDGKEGGFWGQNSLTMVSGKPVVIKINISLSSMGKKKDLTTYIVVRKGCEVASCDLNIVPAERDQKMMLESMMFINGGYEFLDYEDLETVYNIKLDPIKKMTASNDRDEFLTNTVARQATINPPKVAKTTITDQNGIEKEVVAVMSSGRGQRRVVR